MDDELLARASLSVLLRTDPGIEIVSEWSYGVEAPEEIRTPPPFRGDRVRLHLGYRKIHGGGKIGKLHLRADGEARERAKTR